MNNRTWKYRSGRTLCLSLFAALLSTLTCPAAWADDWFYYPPELKGDAEEEKEREKEKEDEPEKPAAAVRLYPEHVDFMTISASLAIGGHAGLRMFTYTGDRIRFTLLDMGAHADLLAAAFDDDRGALPTTHMGSSIAFGARWGEQGRGGHWFTTGLWYGWEEGSGEGTSYEGLFIPVGYEVTFRIGQGGTGVWGLRAFGAISPIGWLQHSYYYDEDEQLATIGSSDHEVRSQMPKVFFGTDVFVGF